jgi:hypothetical protein
VLSDSLGDAFGGRPETPQASTTIEQLPLTNLITASAPRPRGANANA